MIIRLTNISFAILFLISNLLDGQNSIKTNYDLIEVSKSLDTIIIDGIAEEEEWASQEWHPLDQLWLGDLYSDMDFKGRYKLLWKEDALYLLAEITDDILFDQHPDPLSNWWDDDCLEIFIDENNSGGNHQFNHSAFAYHVALDGNVVDMSTDQKGKLYNEHLISSRTKKEQTSLWELKIFLFDDSYSDETGGTPVTQKNGKKIGFALAYCDNDGSTHRENFIGSIKHEGFNQNQGWIDASIFGTLILTE
jgi:hypothetical protein